MTRLQAAAGFLIAALLLIYGTTVYKLRGEISNGSSDFISFYTAGRILRQHAADHLYDLRLQYGVQQPIAAKLHIRKGTLPFVRPAFEAWLFLPLAYLPYISALVLWNLISGAALIASLRILRQKIPHLRRLSRPLTTAVILAFYPLFLCLLQGQDSLLLFLIYVLAFAAMRDCREFQSGMLLGLGLFKFTLIVPFVFPLLLRGRMRWIAGFTLTSLIVCAASAATVGLSAFRAYPAFLLNIDRLAPGVNVPRDMPNLRGLFSLLPASELPQLVASTILVAFSLLLTGWVTAKCSFEAVSNRSSLDLEFSLNLVATLLVSYHAHSFELCLLLLPISLVAGWLLSGESPAPRSRRARIWAAAALAFSTGYVVASLMSGYPCLLALVLLAQASAIAMLISNPRQDSHGEISTPARI